MMEMKNGKHNYSKGIKLPNSEEIKEKDQALLYKYLQLLRTYGVQNQEE